ncbi:MAG: hypothetical protein H6810_06025 [Phycisphaeraceae bacterium]|nr:MAG: hypothetical protein H6810_06025 [Phycisphaeraceae bacterium]
MSEETPNPIAAGSLLDESAEVIGAPAPQRKPAPGWTRVFSMTPGELVGAVGSWIGRHSRVSTTALALLLAGGGSWAWLAYRIEPPPDYETAPIGELFDYTLLTDDFNRLPLEERLALIQKLVTRMKSFSSNDSVLLAIFATMIMGEARAQLEANLSHLAVDAADKYAVDYDPNAPPEEKEQYLKDAYLGLVGMMDFADGEVGEHTPEELLAEGQRQAKRDLARFEKGRVGADEVVRVFDIMNNKVGAHMSGHQKVRISAMFRDMTEMLRKGP